MKERRKTRRGVRERAGRSLSSPERLYRFVRLHDVARGRRSLLAAGCPCNAYVGGTRLPRNSANRPPSGTMDCFGPDGEVAGPENRGTPYLQTHVCAYLFLAHISFGCWHFRPRVALKAARSFGFFVRVHGRPTCLEMGFVQGTCDSNASTG